MAKNPAFALQEAGTAVWLDQLSREIIESGQLAAYIEDAAMSGVTSNPAIFHSAMTSGTAYDAQLEELAGSSRNTEQLYEELAVRDIQMACDVLRPVYDRTGGADGFVSLEVSPHLARDTEGTYAAAKRLHAWVDRANLMIKIPGTDEGLPAIRRCLEDGVPINVTLLFSIDAYEAVAKAYVEAIAARAEKGLSLDVGSVASFFVSRIDSLVDSKLEAAAEKADGSARDAILGLRGKAAVYNAKLAYQSYLRIFGSEDWKRLEGQGARVQRPLWASTSTKNPSYPDVLYVETLVGRHTVNTMPVQTLEATLDHGKIEKETVLREVEEARKFFETLEATGISFDQATTELLDEGIAKFDKPYDDLLAALESKRAKMTS
ncbi:MAG: transaldolase [Candidatus Eisenbacteria bacterium]|uniref:Transaldolase n=1 Tax=Eiseniibacteriota bacterium TaxID=2212470 RepID=A0A956NBT5_UNCEI|nr:transaldolase [Candidatus Eisenbacteria bacterium]